MAVVIRFAGVARPETRATRQFRVIADARPAQLQAIRSAESVATSLPNLAGPLDIRQIKSPAAAGQRDGRPTAAGRFVRRGRVLCKCGRLPCGRLLAVPPGLLSFPALPAHTHASGRDMRQSRVSLITRRDSPALCMRAVIQCQSRERLPPNCTPGLSPLLSRFPFLRVSGEDERLPPGRTVMRAIMRPRDAFERPETAPPGARSRSTKRLSPNPIRRFPFVYPGPVSRALLKASRGDRAAAGARLSISVRPLSAPSRARTGGARSVPAALVLLQPRAQKFPRSRASMRSRRRCAESRRPAAGAQ